MQHRSVVREPLLRWCCPPACAQVSPDTLQCLLHAASYLECPLLLRACATVRAGAQGGLGGAGLRTHTSPWMLRWIRLWLFSSAGPSSSSSSRTQQQRQQCTLGHDNGEQLSWSSSSSSLWCRPATIGHLGLPATVCAVWVADATCCVPCAVCRAVLCAVHEGRARPGHVRAAAGAGIALRAGAADGSAAVSGEVRAMCVRSMHPLPLSFRCMGRGQDGGRRHLLASHCPLCVRQHGLQGGALVGLPTARTVVLALLVHCSVEHPASQR